MMQPKVEAENGTNEDLSSGRLLRDIEEISRALYLHRTPPKDLFASSDYQLRSKVNSRVSESKSNVMLEDLAYKGKKSSIWKWKPLKALTHIRNRRFNCCFFLHVHAIEGLPPNFNDLSLCVNWKRKDEVLRTRPARVYQGMAEFEETLMHRCSVYGNRNGPQSSAKYEPKLFLLNASVIGAPTLDMGKHWIDLTRLLPLTLEELEEEKRTSGKWTTSFKLTGKAKGATINVSFCFSLLNDKSIDPYSFVKLPDNLKGNGAAASDHFEDSGRMTQISTGAMLCRLGSVPRNSSTRSHVSSLSMDFRRIDEILPERGSELARSVSFLYRKLEEEKLGKSDEFDLFHGHLESLTSKSVHVPKLAGESNAYDDTIPTLNEHGMELSLKEELKVEEEANPSSDHSTVETIDVAEVFKDIGAASDISTYFHSKLKVHGDDTDERSVIDDSKQEENDICCEISTIEELESVFSNFLSSESAVLGSALGIDKFVRQESRVSRTSSFKGGKMVRSLSLDDLTESVANDFLNMLGIEQSHKDIDSDSGPESPRERLLRQFEEEESFASGNSIFDFNTTEKEQMDFNDIAATCHGKLACYDDFDIRWVDQEAENEQSRVTQSLRSKRNLKLLENLETRALMEKWGLDEKDFRNSPRISSGGFGSPVHYLPEILSDLPPLGEGFGPIVHTKDGGFLRSMNPLLFRNAKNGARLVIHISRSVVLPAAMGSNVMEIFECWASEGVEKMSSQANELMPLEDMTGKMIQQAFWESECGSEVLQRLTLPGESAVRHDSHGMQEKDENLTFCRSSDNFNLSSAYIGIDSDYVTVDDLLPLVMEKIEVLSVEGLKIQSSMSEKEAPSSIRPRSIGNLVSAQSGSNSSEDSMRSHILDIGDVDTIIKLSLSLDEWMKLDAGDLILEDETNEQILKILAVYHAKFINLSSVQVSIDDEQVKLLGRRGGILGKRFTLALRLQLRDPFRNYEMVGASMLALIQVERIHILMQEEEEDSTLSKRSANEEEGNLNESWLQAQGTPLFKIYEVHVAGLNVEPGDKQTWTARRQQQSGIRWLLSSGMGRNEKHPVTKSKAIVISSAPVNKMAQLGDILWSISSDFQGATAKCEDFAAQNLYVRNPDILFPTESIR